jgi:hypothetical protein
LSTPALPPRPADGSPRYFALLYTPDAARATLGTLLALADEISAGAGRGLDHSVAHVRLEWWRGEAERFARGQPQHPWLRALLAQRPAAAALDLTVLVQAAALDLATETLGGQPGAAVQRALFELAESALPAPLHTGPHDAVPERPPRDVLAALAERTSELERFTGVGPWPPAAADRPGALAATLEALRRQTAALDRTLQPRLAPLLVWITLAARQARRLERAPGRKSASGLDGFADNIAAWNAARRAVRGHFRIG